MKKQILLLLTIILVTSADKASAQMYGVSTNILGWATGTINGAIEFKTSDKWSIEVPIYFNPIVTDNVSMLHITTQPTLKYWYQSVFVGHYLSISNTTSYFKFGRKESMNKGFIVGAGVGYGYSFIINKYISLNIEAGVGAYYTRYDAYKKTLLDTEDELILTHSKIKILPSRLVAGITYYF